jgi:nicotinate dehydrogenase subunit B
LEQSPTAPGQSAPAGGVVVGSEVDPAFPASEVKPIPMPEGGGDRNAIPLYALRNAHVVYHFLKDMRLRVSALRSLGAHHNVFSIECVLDELAKAGGVDPLGLRLIHIEDERARAVIEFAAERFGWSNRTPGDGRVGCGMGFARYKNLGAYCTVMLEIEVDRAIRSRAGSSSRLAGRSASGRRSMRLVEPSTTGTPILRFADMPQMVEVHVVDGAGQPFLGVGECAAPPPPR